MKPVYVCGLLLVVLLTACRPKKDGITEVKSPFSGSSYQSNGRFFRATASGESQNLETAKSKALLTANQRLASAVQTEIKNVSENYVNERNADKAMGDFGMRYQQLTREVINQTLVGVNQVGERIYEKADKTYLVWVVQEVRKREIYKKLKELSAQQSTLSDKEKKVVEEMIDKHLEEIGDKD